MTAAAAPPPPLLPIASAAPPPEVRPALRTWLTAPIAEERLELRRLARRRRWRALLRRLRPLWGWL